MHDSYDLAQLGKVLEVQGEIATVDLGGGTLVRVNLAFTEARIGDYVLVHAGYVLRVVDVEEGKRMLARWNQPNNAESASYSNAARKA
jgi:hydrogenase expression/formation protein HypC